MQKGLDNRIDMWYTSRRLIACDYFFRGEYMKYKLGQMVRINGVVGRIIAIDYKTCMSQPYVLGFGKRTNTRRFKDDWRSEIESGDVVTHDSCDDYDLDYIWAYENEIDGIALVNEE